MKLSHLLTLLFISSLSFGQTAPNCGYTDFLNYELSENPDLKDGIEATNKEANQWLQNRGQSKSSVITIPVVVHIIYNDASQNISDSQVKSQIRVLNRDFNRQNTDAFKTPEYFKGVAADCEILFCLANIDPQGNPTNGITRTMTNKIEIGAQGSNDYYLTANGGADVWDRDKYLNIWVCDVGTEVLGYATTPSLTTNKAKDGIVIGYSYFGTEGFPPNFANALGRTTTHEVGHWLGLEHTWGNGDPSGSNCGIDDGISDTPNQENATFGCPSTIQISCNNGPEGDMFMNYMDYTDDACMNLFTEGQKTRMLSILNSNPRKTLFNSNGGCSYTGIASNDTKSNLFEMHPNPTAGEFTISFTEFNNEDITLKIFNTSGQLVYFKTFQPNGKQLLINAPLKDGIYSVLLEQSNLLFVKKLVVHHPF